MESDLQLGYEIYDRAYEINSAIQAVVTASSRNYIIQNDPTTQSAVIALNSIATQLRSAPTTFFSEIIYAASSRSNNENWHLSRLVSYHATYMKQLEVLTNSTGPLSKLAEIANPSIVGVMSESLDSIKEYSQDLLYDLEKLTYIVGQVRANATLLLTPKFINDFIDENLLVNLQQTLIVIRNSYLYFLSAVRDVTRLTGAHHRTTFW